MYAPDNRGRCLSGRIARHTIKHILLIKWWSFRISHSTINLAQLLQHFRAIRLERGISSRCEPDPCSLFHGWTFRMDGQVRFSQNSCPFPCLPSFAQGCSFPMSDRRSFHSDTVARTSSLPILQKMESGLKFFCVS